MACQIAFCVFILYYLIVEIIQVWKDGFREYFFKFSNWIEVIVVCLGVAAIGLRIHLEVKLSAQLSSLLQVST